MENKVIEEITLVNKNYGKVLDTVALIIESDKEIKTNQKRVLKLLDLDEERIKEFTKSFNIFWNNLPEDTFIVNNIDEFNDKLNKFSQYILFINENQKGLLKDYGYTILILYYFKIGYYYLENVV